MAARSKSIVRLNVGGEKFTTTINTLCLEPESMLAKLVSEQWLQLESSTSKNGFEGQNQSKISDEMAEIFIDR